MSQANNIYLTIIIILSKITKHIITFLELTHHNLHSQFYIRNKSGRDTLFNLIIQWCLGIDLKTEYISIQMILLNKLCRIFVVCSIHMICWGHAHELNYVVPGFIFDWISIVRYSSLPSTDASPMYIVHNSNNSLVILSVYDLLNKRIQIKPIKFD